MTASRQRSYRRTVVSFLALGFILQAAAIAVWSIGDLVFDDFIHDNPYRPWSDALIQIALSPLRGLFGALMISELWLGGATILALASHRIWGRVPFGSIMVMLPICGSLLYLQGQVVLAPGDTDLDFSLPYVVLRNATMQLPILIGCWWWNDRAATKVTG
jgi:hypothetical protein